MEKNWLIRTKNNHILGPVSRDKVQDLIVKGSIKGDDEICSGNGYWIYVREQDLVAKYVVDNNTQGFNPVSEAEPTGAISPIESDLEYPDMDDIISKVDASSPSIATAPIHTPVKSEEPIEQEEPKLSTPSVQEVAEELNFDQSVDNEIYDDNKIEELFPEDDDLEYPDEMEVLSKISSEMGDPNPPAAPVAQSRPKPVPKPVKTEPQTPKPTSEKSNVVPMERPKAKVSAQAPAPKMRKRRVAPTPKAELKNSSRLSVKFIYAMIISFPFIIKDNWLTR